jgi:alpha-L-rhamnosidase
MLVLGMSSCGSPTPGPIKLKVETLTNPQGLDSKHPRFSWQIESDQTNILQHAYHILVAKSAKDLKNETNLVWNSGKVESGNSVLIPYAGETLESEKTYYWKVKVTTNKGESTWSKPATYTMAFMNDPLPLANWIGIDSMLNSGKLTTKTRLSARYLRKKFTLEKEIQKATLYISGLGMYESYINGKKSVMTFLLLLPLITISG